MLLILKRLKPLTSIFISVPVRPGYEDDKVQLPFTVTDLKGRNLQLVTGPYNGQVFVCASVTVVVVLRVLEISLQQSGVTDNHSTINVFFRWPQPRKGNLMHILKH